MAKQIPVVTLSSPDTAVYLPLSKKRVLVSKDLPADKIALLDKYFSKNKKIPTETETVSPMLQACNDRVFYNNWEAENQYIPVTGKNLGIWTNDISIYKSHNQYGFTSLFVTSTNDIDSGYADGFSYNNMMLDLGSSSSVTPSFIQSINTGGRYVGSYYIDEPIETFGKGKCDWDTPNLESYVYPKRLMLSSYAWPVDPYYYSYPSTYGEIYGPIISYSNNTYIMCDEYPGDCFGRVTYYWSEFWNYYGHNKNTANWMNVIINQGNTPSECYGAYNASSFTDLFNQANYEGLNEIWLYAQGIGSESDINLFCSEATQEGWLLKLWKQYSIEYKCEGTCTDCVWPTVGAWYVYRIWYTGQEQYLPY